MRARCCIGLGYCIIIPRLKGGGWWWSCWRGGEVRGGELFAKLTRFLRLMTALFMVTGRWTLCSLKYSPQALQMVLPLLSRRQSGVVVVRQLAQTRF